MSLTRTAASLFLAAALGGCGASGATAGSRDCPDPGQLVSCTCEDGRQGLRACGETACDCPTPTYALRAEPGSLDFGDVPRGTARQALVRIHNPAPREVRLASIDFVEDPGPNFELSQAVPSAIPAGGSIDIPLGFAAVQVGSALARLRVLPDDGAIGPVEVAVSGRVSGPVLSCTPDTVIFPERWVGDEATATVVCANVGFASAADPALLALDRLEIEGDGFAAGWREAPPAPRLAVGEAATIELVMAGAAAGERLGTLAVGGGDQTALIALAGVLLDWPACDVEIVPDQLRFGIVDKGTAAVLEFAIRNPGDAPCRVEAIRLCDDTDPIFSLPVGLYEDVVIPPHAELRIPIRFDPGAGSCEGGLEGCIEIHLAQDVVETLELECPAPTSGADCALIAPNDLDFGTVVVGQTAISREVQLINTCSAPLLFGGIEFNAGATGEFLLLSQPPPGSVPPGLSVSFTLGYAPVDEGTDLGSIFVFDPDHRELGMATLRGRARAP